MFCVFFLFRFSMIITGDRKQMAFSVHWKLYDHCCVRVDFSLLLRYSSKLIIQLEKKYSFPIFGCWRIPAWRNGSWFRTYLIGFSQEEINEQFCDGSVYVPETQLRNGLNSNWTWFLIINSLNFCHNTKQNLSTIK